MKARILALAVALSMMAGLAALSANGYPADQPQKAEMDGVITGDETVSQPTILSADLIIESTGRLLVNGTEFTLDQDQDDEFEVVVRGTLEIIGSSTFKSSFKYDIIVEGDGRLLVSDSEIKNVGTLVAIDGTASIMLNNSVLGVASPEPLSVASLEMRASEMALDEGLAGDDLFFSSIDCDTLYVQSCQSLTVSSSWNLDKEQVSSVTSLTCVFSRNSINLSGTVIESASLLSGWDLAITGGCDITDLSLGTFDSVVFRDSTVGGDISLQGITSFSAYGSTINSDLESEKPVNLEDVTAQELVLRGGGVLTRVDADKLIVTSTKTTELKVYGWKHATDIADTDAISTEGIDVSAKATVLLYRFIEVSVDDYNKDPLPGVNIIVEEDLGSAPLVNGTTDATGKATLAVLSCEIDKDGETYIGNVQVHAEFDSKSTEPEPLAMTENRALDIHMEDVNIPPEEEKEDESWFGLLCGSAICGSWITVIIVVLVIVVLLALAGGAGWAYYEYFY